MPFARKERDEIIRPRVTAHRRALSQEEKG
jgi:hypothetical protein